MQGHAIWLIGSPSSAKSDLGFALREKLEAQGKPVEILSGAGRFACVSSPEPRMEDWSGYFLDAVQISKILTRNGTTVIVPVPSISEEAYAVARVEIDRFTGVCIDPRSAPADPNPGYANLSMGPSIQLAANGSGVATLVQTVKQQYDVVLSNEVTLEQNINRIIESTKFDRPGAPSESRSPASDPLEVEVTILMPCLNEADAIRECVLEANRALRDAHISGEVLVVDNGSTDGSSEIAQAAGARVVHEPNRGYGSAYLRGFREGRGKYFVMGDADGTYDFSLVPEFLERLRAGHEFVNGSRIKGKMEAGAIPFLHRWVGVPALTWVLNFLSGAKFSDAHCGMRGFSRDAVHKMGLRSSGMEFASEMILQASRTNLRTSEIPIPYRTRKGESKLRTFSDGWRHIRFMLLHSPTHLFVVPGLFFLLTGLLITLALVGGKLDIAGLSFDIHYMVVGSVLAIVGYQLAALGMSARLFALSIGIFRKDRLIDWGYKHLNLERGIVIGGLVSVAGIGVLLYIVVRWITLDFGFNSSGMMGPAILGMTLLVLGAQTVFSAFFLSLLSMKFNQNGVSVN